jgi:cytochrome P450
VQAEPFRLGPWNLPKGTRISPCLYLAHHRPESWPQPKQFSPQRFVGMQIDPYRWLPFGGGNRRCIGLSFALFEMRLVLGAVFTQARPQLASPKPVRPVRRGVTIGPGGGTRVVLT